MIQRIRLKHGVDPAHALETLLESQQRAQAITSPDAGHAFENYRAWVEWTEQNLAALTHDPKAVTMLLSRRHFLIQDIGPNPARLWGSLYAERDLQIAALQALAGIPRSVPQPAGCA